MRSGLVATLTRRTGDLAALVIAAALMVVSAIDHIHLWDIAYRHVATLGPLFLVQAIAGIVLAVVIVASRLAAAVLAGAVLMVGTIGGFIIADTVGLFGFTLPEVTSWAYLALSTEGVSTIILVTVLVRHMQRSGLAPTAG